MSSSLIFSFIFEINRSSVSLQDHISYKHQFSTRIKIKIIFKWLKRVLVKTDITSREVILISKLAYIMEYNQIGLAACPVK